jgi:hypothetical protein
VWESNPPFDPLRTESPALKAGEITGPLSPPLQILKILFDIGKTIWRVGASFGASPLGGEFAYWRRAGLCSWSSSEAGRLREPLVLVPA